MTQKLWRVGEEELRYIKSAFEKGLKGEFNKKLEERFADKFGVNYAIGVNSGTSALHAALYAIGVGEGDEVIVPPITFAATAFAPLYLNANPIFADIAEDTFTIDPDDIIKKITPKTKAIIPVSLYGLPADMKSILKIAKDHNLFVVEDSAECFLGSIKSKFAGTFGDLGIFSFERSKHMTTGNGGIVVTNDETLATLTRKFSVLGYRILAARQDQHRISLDEIQHPDYKRHDMIGFNYRLPEICAAMGLAQLEKLDFLVDQRKKIASLYLDALKGCDWLKAQHVPDQHTHSYWCFTVVIDEQKSGVSWSEFRKIFLEEGGDRFYSAWAITYLEPVFSNNPFLSKLGYKEGICPNAEKLQPKLIQFKTNFENLEYANRQADILKRTIDKIDCGPC